MILLIYSQSSQIKKQKLHSLGKQKWKIRLKLTTHLMLYQPARLPASQKLLFIICRQNPTGVVMANHVFTDPKSVYFLLLLPAMMKNLISDSSSAGNAVKKLLEWQVRYQRSKLPTIGWSVKSQWLWRRLELRFGVPNPQPSCPGFT